MTKQIRYKQLAWREEGVSGSRMSLPAVRLETCDSSRRLSSAGLTSFLGSSDLEGESGVLVRHSDRRLSLRRRVFSWRGLCSTTKGCLTVVGLALGFGLMVFGEVLESSGQESVGRRCKSFGSLLMGGIFLAMVCYAKCKVTEEVDVQLVSDASVGGEDRVALLAKSPGGWVIDDEIRGGSFV